MFFLNSSLLSLSLTFVFFFCVVVRMSVKGTGEDVNSVIKDTEF